MKKRFTNYAAETLLGNLPKTVLVNVREMMCRAGFDFLIAGLLTLLPGRFVRGASLAVGEIPLGHILGWAAHSRLPPLTARRRRLGRGVRIRSFRRAAAPPCCGVLSQSFGRGCS